MSSLGNKEIMAKNIKYYMDLNDIDRNKLCEDLKIKYTTLCDWLNAKTYPRIDKIEMMSDYFGIQKSDLVEDKNEVTSQNQTPNNISKSGVHFVHADGKIQTFDMNSIIYSIMESLSELPIETQEIIQDVVEGQKNRKIIHVKNPQEKPKSNLHLLPNAAHTRTDIPITDADIAHDEDIMDDDKF
jgi:transcriptional regulator with XRE-family HTH domain